MSGSPLVLICQYGISSKLREKKMIDIENKNLMPRSPEPILYVPRQRIISTIVNELEEESPCLKCRSLESARKDKGGGRGRGRGKDKGSGRGRDKGRSRGRPKVGAEAETKVGAEAGTKVGAEAGAKVGAEAGTRPEAGI
ncbi:hypothetical protein PoB_005005400 [Plakobranchus ocellatus]|uniref:Uncharacterized protein n=1 Tax=Plakobranchus ocellatus TaxID=259542 RepID=A0AAV4BYS8_9GAST|nr:hypothetical protein PoB_005005400 [Plakobranchus ocellatus]